MANDWIKIRKDLFTDPNVGQLSDILETEDAHTVGMLVVFWSWVDTHSVDGVELPITERRIDRMVGCSGFAAGMVSIGWLEGESGRLTIPNFSRHNGNSAKARSLESEAKRLRREGKSQTKKDTKSDEVSDTVSDNRPTKNAENVRPEKRREEVYYRESINVRERVEPTLEECEQVAVSFAPATHAEFAASVGREFFGVFASMQPAWITRGGDDLCKNDSWKHKLRTKLENEIRAEISRQSRLAHMGKTHGGSARDSRGTSTNPAEGGEKIQLAEL